MVVGIRFIRKWQIAWKERFYDPDKGGFMRNIGAVRFAFYASEYVKDENEEETASVAPTSLCDPNTVSNTVRIAQDTDRPETVVVEFAAGKGVAAVHAIRRQQERRSEGAPHAKRPNSKSTICGKRRVQIMSILRTKVL